MQNRLPILDLDKVIHQVRRLAAENPDTVYCSPGGYCFYTQSKDASDKGCIIGQAIIAAYPEHQSILADLDAAGRGVAVPELLSTVFTISDDHMDKKDWLRNVQQQQDSGRMWSSCVTEAEIRDLNYF